MMNNTPKVTIEVFGMLEAVARADSIEMPVGDNTSAADAIEFVIHKYPDANIDKESMIISINHHIVPPETVLHPGDSIVLLPPIGGG
jgi:molybdopterin synthase sulfur carrier subunit